MASALHGYLTRKLPPIMCAMLPTEASLVTDVQDSVQRLGGNSTGNVVSSTTRCWRVEEVRWQPVFSVGEPRSGIHIPNPFDDLRGPLRDLGKFGKPLDGLPCECFKIVDSAESWEQDGSQIR